MTIEKAFDHEIGHGAETVKHITGSTADGLVQEMRVVKSWLAERRPAVGSTRAMAAVDVTADERVVGVAPAGRRHRLPPKEQAASCSELAAPTVPGPPASFGRLARRSGAGSRRDGTDFGLPASRHVPRASSSAASRLGRG